MQLQSKADELCGLLPGVQVGISGVRAAASKCPPLPPALFCLSDAFENSEIHFCCPSVVTPNCIIRHLKFGPKVPSDQWCVMLQCYLHRGNKRDYYTMMLNVMKTSMEIYFGVLPGQDSLAVPIVGQRSIWSLDSLESSNSFQTPISLHLAFGSEPKPSPGRCGPFCLLGVAHCRLLSLPTRVTQRWMRCRNKCECNRRHTAANGWEFQHAQRQLGVALRRKRGASSCRSERGNGMRRYGRTQLKNALLGGSRERNGCGTLDAQRRMGVV